ncbi:hypothetical protein V6Z12_D05G324400 [Gossypium hirsutum]
MIWMVSAGMYSLSPHLGAQNGGKRDRKRQRP